MTQHPRPSESREGSLFHSDLPTDHESEKDLVAPVALRQARAEPARNGPVEWTELVRPQEAGELSQRDNCHHLPGRFMEGTHH